MVLPLVATALHARAWALTAFLLVTIAVPVTSYGEDLFAVVTHVGKDKRQVTAQVSASGTVSEAVLIPSDTVTDSPIWRKIEMCHSLRAEGTKTPEGYQISSIRLLDAGMLPMTLQGIAGDCLLRKALEVAPLVD